MFAESAADLVQLLRHELNDTVEDYLWSDFELYAYLTEACDDLARTTQGIYKVLSLAVAEGNPLVRLPSYVDHIRTVRLLTAGSEVSPANTHSFAALRDDYGMATTGGVEALFGSATGTPRHFVRDYSPGYLRLVPTPNAADTLEVQCTITIDETIDSGSDLPFLEPIDQRLLIEYCKGRAYRKRDAETEDLVRAREHETAYRSGAQDRAAQLRNTRRTPGTVRMEWL